MSGVRVCIVEDHPVLREILGDYVSRMAGVASCLLVGSAEAALEQVEDDPPDLVLVDFSLPGMNGIELIRRLRRKLPELPCAILTGHRVSSYVSEALIAGAKGYLLKDDPQELEQGVRSILAGDRFVSRGLDDAY